jgi:hypothetical protein
MTNKRLFGRLGKLESARPASSESDALYQANLAWSRKQDAALALVASAKALAGGPLDWRATGARDRAAGLRSRPPADPFATTAFDPSAGLLQPGSRLFDVDASRTGPGAVPAFDEKQRKLAELRALRGRLTGYQLTSAEALALMNKHPELQIAEDWKEPTPPPEPEAGPERLPWNPWGMYVPSYASEEEKAAVRAFGGYVAGDDSPMASDRSGGKS